MERDSFIFYRSFYESVKDLPKDIRLEVYTAIMEYALYGRLPQALKPFANGIFTLIKPNIDVNTARFENGKKGGRKSGTKKQASSKPAYTVPFEQEVEQMRTDEKWRKTICEDFNITAEEYGKRLSRFLDRCMEDKTLKSKEHHDSYEDCQSHLRYWMAKAYSPKPPESVSPATKRQQQEAELREEHNRKLREEWREQERNAVPYEEYLRRKKIRDEGKMDK